MTHKFEDEINSAVSQLVKLKIETPPHYYDPLSIIEKYREMEVLKNFQKIKI